MWSKPKWHVCGRYFCYGLYSNEYFVMHKAHRQVGYFTPEVKKGGLGDVERMMIMGEFMKYLEKNPEAWPLL
jgi:hypothetical protein